LHYKQPFGIFEEHGQRLAFAEEALEAQLIFVIEGGQWFWPPVKIGYVRLVPGTSFELETLSVQPVLYRIRGFLEQDECEQIVSLGQGRMFNSPVSLMDKDKGKAAKEFRTSTQAQLPSSTSPLLGKIDNRIAHLTRVPVEHNEAVQILRYEKTQYYSAHLDNWDPEYYQGNLEGIEHGHKNRLITVFWYLTNVSSGGETLFPRAHGLPQPMDMYSCENGLKVKPEKGSVIFWYSLHPNGNTNPNGLHAACPVVDGQKWSANYWVWNKPRGGSKAMPDMDVDDFDKSEIDDKKNGGRWRQQARQSSDGSLSVEFSNPLDKSVHLFWAGPNGEVHLGKINAGETKNMITYLRHVWHIREGPQPSSELLLKHVIDGRQTQYSTSKAEL